MPGPTFLAWAAPCTACSREPMRFPVRPRRIVWSEESTIGHVPISDVRPDLPIRLAAVLERLLAHNPDDRFSSAVEAAETLEAMIHLRGGQNRGSRGKDAGKTPRPSPPSSLSGPEPEAPVDWSLVESELASKSGRGRAEPLVRQAENGQPNCYPRPRPGGSIPIAGESRKKGRSPGEPSSSNTARN